MRTPAAATRAAITAAQDGTGATKEADDDDGGADEAAAVLLVETVPAPEERLRWK